MPAQRQHPPDEFDVLSAMWILACLDNNPTMTYNSIRHRLNLPDTHDLQNIVYKHGELFRRRIPPRRLEGWKAEMLTNPSSRPSWVRELTDEPSQLAAIDALTVDDGFRSQFRSERGAPPSSIEIIDWGLQHIERLRKASSETRTQSIQRWQLWSVILLSIVNIVVTIVIALLK